MINPRRHWITLFFATVAVLFTLLVPATILAQEPNDPDKGDDQPTHRTPLPAPSGFGVTTDGTSATLSWNTHPAAGRFKVEYKASTSSTWTTRFVNPASSGKTTTTISGLTCNPFTTYQFRVSAWGDGPGDPIPFGPATAAISRPFDCEVEIPSFSVPYAIKDSTFSLTLPVAEEGSGTYSYSVSGNPSWLTWTASSRTLRGTPDSTGSWNITYSANDGVTTDSKLFTVRAVEPLVLPGVTSFSVVEGKTISRTVGKATGGLKPYTYTMTGRPTGVTFSASTRKFGGSAESTGTFTPTYRVSDSSGQSDSSGFTLTVVSELELPAVSNATGEEGTAFSKTLSTATGGTGNYTYNLSGDALPTGLAESSGTISGTLGDDTAGTYNLTWSVGDRATHNKRTVNLSPSRLPRSRTATIFRRHSPRASRRPAPWLSITVTPPRPRTSGQSYRLLTRILATPLPTA